MANAWQLPGPPRARRQEKRSILLNDGLRNGWLPNRGRPSHRFTTTWSWRQRVEVPAVHNKLRHHTCKRRVVKLNNDGFLLSRQQRKIVIAPEIRDHVFAAFAASEPEMQHECIRLTVAD